jgi:hypothetical protein
VQGVVIVYSAMFLSVLVLPYVGIPPKTYPQLYPLLILLMGTMGVALALRLAETTRPLYLVWIGVGVFVLNSITVWLSIQSLTGWVTRSLFIAMAVILGRLSVGSSLDIDPTPTLSCSTLVKLASRSRRIPSWSNSSRNL